MIFLTKLSRIYPHAILLQTASWAWTGLMYTFHALPMRARKKTKLKSGFVHTNTHTTVLSKTFWMYPRNDNWKVQNYWLSLDLAILKYGFWKKSVRQNATLNSWTLSHLHKKVPVVIDHTIRIFQMLWFISIGTFLWRWKCSTIQSCILPKWLFTKSIL